MNIFKNSKTLSSYALLYSIIIQEMVRLLPPRSQPIFLGKKSKIAISMLMGDITNKLGQFHIADPSRFKVLSIEADPEGFKSIKFKDLELRSDKLCQLYTYFLLKNKVDEFIQQSRPTQIFEKPLSDVLHKIKKLFEQLSHDNLSQNYRFAEDLSTNWHILLRYIEEYEQGSTQHTEFPILHTFIQEIQNFPSDTPFTLGYYLSQFTGEKWLPFPFMDILYSLHEDSVLSGENSLLHRWIGYLDHTRL